ncbi:MAG: enoyl-CoA hydratase/isomerase family protein [Gammaproteobacteria bacterium]|nr:enoyl-CoA hydratase/isomerase family protein [Gammaproteobacteria bacterium]
MPKNTANWKLTTEKDGIVWLYLDKEGTSTNILSVNILEELNALIDGFEKEMPTGIVFASAKDSGFIAGADINEFTQVKNYDEALELIKRGQNVFSRIEHLPCPTVAMISGFCLGGGLELSLACDYRVTDDQRSTRLGLPEVKLGIHPGFGGSVRLIRIVNANVAMDMMLTGRSLDPRRAKRIGLIDHMVAKRQLKKAARHMVLAAPDKRSLSRLGKLMAHSMVRPYLAKYMRKQVAKKAPQEHYPAPYALIQIWEKHAGNSNRMMQEEAMSVARLVEDETAKNLIRVFQLQDALKAQGDKSLFQPSHVHVIGGGVMGGDIAAWCAVRGFKVTLQDREPQYLTAALQRANTLFKRKFKKDRYAIQDAMDRLIPDHKGYGVKHADVVIEAIYENIEAKQALYKEIEPQLKAEAILATNTSSIPLETLCEKMQQPERLVGLHFFNPVALMPLVEIVKGENTSDDALAKAAAFTRHIDRLPLYVKSSPGFLVNRILMPYLIEAVQLLSEGVTPEAIDKAAKDFGMPMGPVELADTVGLDICLSVAGILSKALGFEISKNLEEIVAKGTLGKKTGKGFYRWKNGRPVKNKDASMGDQKQIQERLILRLVNESMACLSESVVSDVDQIDAGVIFGTGFAPFRGGPLHYAETLGADTIKLMLSNYTDNLGERFKPNAGWK